MFGLFNDNSRIAPTGGITNGELKWQVREGGTVKNQESFGPPEF